MDPEVEVKRDWKIIISRKECPHKFIDDQEGFYTCSPEHGGGFYGCDKTGKTCMEVNCPIKLPKSLK